MRFAAVVLFAALGVHAQAPEVYKVELTMHDAADSSAKAGRRYTILIDTRGKGSFRIGNREPVASGSFQPGAGGVGVNPLVNTQWTYLDTGVSIDCRLEPSDGRLQLTVDMDISTIAQRDKGNAPTPPNPTVAQLKLNVTAFVTPGRRTPVASVDDPVTNRKFDVEALVTKGD